MWSSHLCELSFFCSYTILMSQLAIHQKNINQHAGVIGLEGTQKQCTAEQK